MAAAMLAEGSHSKRNAPVAKCVLSVPKGERAEAIRAAAEVVKAMKPGKSKP